MNIETDFSPKIRSELELGQDTTPAPVFKTPSEEIEYLRSRIREKQILAKDLPRQIDIEDHAQSVVAEHRSLAPNHFADDAEQYEKKVSGIVASLGHKGTDSHITELAGVMLEQGVRMAIDIAEKLKSPEIEDDFHRFLISYLLSGHDDEASGLGKSEWRALHLKLFEVIPPSFDASDAKKDPKNSIAMMEQLYAALQSVASDPQNSKDNYYALEIALAQDSNEVVFYIAVPTEVEAILEKTLQGYFPGIEVRAHAEDYNIFHDNGIQVGAFASTTLGAALPLKTYKNIEGDPISVIMGSFTKLQKRGEGAALQILVRPAGDSLKKDFGNLLDNMQKNGDSFEKAIKRESFLGGMYLKFKESGGDKDDKDKQKENDKTYKDTEHIKLISEKISSTIVESNIRVFASAQTVERANIILGDLKASFSQYTESHGNSLIFKSVDNKDFASLAHQYIYRLWDSQQSLPLNFSELATLYHIPVYIKDFAQVKSAKMTTGAAPLDLDQSGIYLGTNDYRGIKTEVHFKEEDRLRHMYVIGQTGTGKSAFLTSMIVQDIMNGDGCCFIDPHGDDVMKILANIPPERYDDVVYFDPSYTARPMGLNMLEYDKDKPEQKTFVINELLGIFNRLFDMRAQGGAGFEAMFRNTAQLVMEHPESGNTLLELSRTLSDKDFRDYKLSKNKNPIVHQFWKNAESTTGEQGLSNWVPFINSKIDPFLSNDIMRPVVAQEKSSFNIREIMDTKKIFLVNLSKGKLGEQNSYLIGLILVGKFLQAALGRADSAERPPFYLYIDEFQNVTTPSIAQILSEARKYKLSLNVAHQFIGQLPDDIKSAVFGNVGSKVTFRVGPDDAAYLEKEFTPEFSSGDIMKIENLNCYVKLLSNSTPQKPFSMKTKFAPVGNPDQVEMLKQMSYMKYGRDRAEVEEEIMGKYNV